MNLVQTDTTQSMQVRLCLSINSAAINIRLKSVASLSIVKCLYKTFIKLVVAVLVISNVIPSVFITAAIVLSLKELSSFLFSRIVCVTVNYVDSADSLVTGNSTNIATYLTKVSIHVSLIFLCQ